MLGRLFVVAAAVDFVARLIGLAGLHSYIDLAVPLAIVTSFLPHYALLVFPVVVLARNPDAGARHRCSCGAPSRSHSSSFWARRLACGSPPRLTTSRPGRSSSSGSPWPEAARTSPSPLACAPSTVRSPRRRLPGSPTLSGPDHRDRDRLDPRPAAGSATRCRRSRMERLVPAGRYRRPPLAAGVRQPGPGRHPRRDRRRGAAATLAAGAMVVSGTDALFTLAFGALVLLQSAFAISAPVVSGGFALGFLGGELVLALLVVAFGLGLGDIRQNPRDEFDAIEESQASVGSPFHPRTAVPIASSSGASGPATGPRPRTPTATTSSTTRSARQPQSSTSRRSTSTASRAATHLPSSTGSSPATPRSSTSARSSTPWCDEHGKVIDDGTVHRLSEDEFFWTAADPQLRWLTLNARGLDVQIEDVTEAIAAVALQGRSPERSSRTRRRSHSTSCATSGGGRRTSSGHRSRAAWSR